MGVFDMYCSKCGLAFTPFQNAQWNTKTQWMKNAICEYKGHKIYLTDYNSYGAFKLTKPLPAAAIKDDVQESLDEEGNLIIEELIDDYLDGCYHVACKSLPKISGPFKHQMMQFHDQFFNEKMFLKHKNLLPLLDASTHKSLPMVKLDVEEKIKKPKKIERKPCTIINPETGRSVNVDGPTGIKLLKKYVPELLGQ